MKRKRVTIKDVAAQAGVSRQTVSRVMNDTDVVAATTRQRVLAATEDLGYRPSKLARAMVTRQTNTIGLAMSDITNPFFPQVAHGVLEEAQANGYSVFICNSGGDPQQELELVQSLADHAVDGIIIYSSYESKDNLKTFAARYQPLVVINHLFEHPGVSQVMIDTPQGARLALDYLVDKGHTAIAMLTGVQDPASDRVRRIRAFREALVSHDLSIADEWITPCYAPTYECGYQATRQLLTQHPQVTAIFAYNDLLALGAIQACNSLNRRVPKDCAIVGFDDIPWAALSTPPLTSIRVDKGELGRQAMRRLLMMLDDPDAVFPPSYLNVELIVRESA